MTHNDYPTQEEESEFIYSTLPENFGEERDVTLPNLDNSDPDSFIENLLVEENKRLRAQVTALRDRLAESQAHIDALQSQYAALYEIWENEK